MTIKENKGHREVGSVYSSLCEWQIAVKDENELKIVEIIIRGEGPKQDVTEDWNYSLHTKCSKSVFDWVCLCALRALCRRVTLILAALQEHWEFTVMSQAKRKQDLFLRLAGFLCCSKQKIESSTKLLQPKCHFLPR